MDEIIDTNGEFSSDQQLLSVEISSINFLGYNVTACELEVLEISPSFVYANECFLKHHVLLLECNSITSGDFSKME